MADRIVFHIDVNSAFLSWSAVDYLSKGEKIDLRKIPSIVGGDETKRHGVVLAKSISAKKYGIETGEPIVKAKKKCADILVIPPSFSVYSKYSKAMFKLLEEYTPIIQKFSIDECFLDLTGEKQYLKLAYIIKDRIKKELGFTVNMGISNNKLLAKMASDFEKPDKIHTLFPCDIKNKMWPLPVEDLFMVGKATLPKLNGMNIYTIGDLAKYDLTFLKYKFKNYGELLWNNANGIDNSKVETAKKESMKSIGNSTTLTYDVTNRESAHKVINSLCENTSMKLRSNKFLCYVIAVSIKNSSFQVYSKQKKLTAPTDCTNTIIKYSHELFDKLWKGEPIRLLGITLGDLCREGIKQLSLFDDKNYEEKLQKNRSLDKTIDGIKNKYGNNSVVRSSFLNED